MSVFAAVIFHILAISNVLGLKSSLQNTEPQHPKVYSKTGVPYHLKLRYFNGFICDAVLLLGENNRQIVLTSGSCLTVKYPHTGLILSEHLAVFAGKAKLDGDIFNEQYQTARHIVRHSEWKRTPDGIENDLAIIFITQNFPINDQVLPVKLDYSKDQSTNLTISFSTATGIHEEVLTTVNNLCSSAIKLKSFCTQRTSSGVGGSPAIYYVNGTKYLAGIFSTNNMGDDGEQAVSVFVNISQYTDWINKVSTIDLSDNALRWLMNKGQNVFHNKDSTLDSKKLHDPFNYKQFAKHVVKRSLRTIF